MHWDERAIAEHDGERGTRTKITEPKTPFSHSPVDSDEDADVTDERKYGGIAGPPPLLPPEGKARTDWPKS